MEDVNQLLNGLEEKVKTLIIKQKSIQQRNEELEKTNQTLTNQIRQNETKIKELEEQNKLTKNQTIEISENTNLMKGKINDMVKEIDQCIAQLS